MSFLDPLINIQFGDTRLFVKVSDIAGIRDSLIAAALTYAHTQDATTTAISAGPRLLNDARSRIRIMSDDEVVVLDLLRKLSGGALYNVYVDGEVLVQTMVVAAEDDGYREKCIRLLRQMEERGLLKESYGAWKAVR